MPPAAAVPLRARLTALGGALILSPDTMLMRLAKMQTSNQLSTAMGIAFYRGLGRGGTSPHVTLLVAGALSSRV
jgi:hypothetical protein